MSINGKSYIVVNTDASWKDELARLARLGLPDPHVTKVPRNA